MSRSSGLPRCTERRTRAHEAARPPTPWHGTALGRTHRQQHRALDTQQRERIDVLAVQASTEVQPRGAGDVPRLQHPDLLTSFDRITGAHECYDRFEARHETIRVLDREHGAARDRAREPHDALLRCEHGCAGSRSDVDAAMTWPVGCLGRVEGAHHLMRRDRP